MRTDSRWLRPLSQPENAHEKLPGIIVIHEAYGLNNQIRGVAKRYAEQGFVALAPNLFSRFGEVMSEKNIESAMRPLWSIPPEKRRDPKTIEDLDENHVRIRSQGDGNFLHGKGGAGKEALERSHTAARMRSSCRVR